MSIYVPPLCPTCAAALLRWSWFDWPAEPITYWYCLECDCANRLPHIFTFKKNELRRVMGIGE